MHQNIGLSGCVVVLSGNGLSV